LVYRWIWGQEEGSRRTPREQEERGLGRGTPPHIGPHRPIPYYRPIEHTEHYLPVQRASTPDRHTTTLLSYLGTKPRREVYGVTLPQLVSRLLDTSFLRRKSGGLRPPDASGGQRERERERGRRIPPPVHHIAPQDASMVM
jgi:hypothetical protein